MGRKSAVIMSLYRNDTIEFVTLAVESILNQSYTDLTCISNMTVQLKMKLMHIFHI